MADEKRLIDANSLSEEVDKSKHNNPHPPGIVRVNHRNEHDHFLRMIYDAPTVDAVEVVHGRWVLCQDDGYEWYECSLCRTQPLNDYNEKSVLSDYCPNCGAKMGSDGSAAGGRRRDQSEWQRSAADEAALAARKMPGTATGLGGNEDA